MFTYESDRRDTDPDDRAHDHLAAAAVNACTGEEIAAAIRVLDAMRDRELTEDLARRITYDPSGNPVTITPEQRLAQTTWSAANNLTDRLHNIRSALSYAASETT